MKQEGFTRKESFAHERADSCCLFCLSILGKAD